MGVSSVCIRYQRMNHDPHLEQNTWHRVEWVGVRGCIRGCVSEV